MKIKKITIELMVDDMKKTIDFYQEILGFQVTVSVPEENPFFVIINHESIELMLYQRDQFGKEIPKFKKMSVGGSIALYLEVENIKSLFDCMKGKVKIIQTIHETDYGSTEFSFEDCNGYVLMLAGK